MRNILIIFVCLLCSSAQAQQIKPQPIYPTDKDTSYCGFVKSEYSTWVYFHHVADTAMFHAFYKEQVQEYCNGSISLDEFYDILYSYFDLHDKKHKP